MGETSHGEYRKIVREMLELSETDFRNGGGKSDNV